MKYSDLKLGDISNVFRGISIPRDRTSVDFEIPYLHYGDIYKIYNNYLDVSKEIKSIIKIKSNEKIKEYQYLQSDDIVINLTSENYEDLGKSIYIDNKDNKLVAGMETTIIRFNKSIKHSPLFLKYYFDTSFFYNDILQYVRGMKVFRVNPKDLLRAKLPNIVLNQQIKIAEYIKNLDDKIEINNKINQNLETLAQTLYKQWFVHFEFPNQNGEPYKSSGGEMIDSELGLIPKGWEVKEIQDIAETILGGTPSRSNKDYWGPGFQWLKSGELNNFRIIKGTEEITELGLKNSATKLMPNGTTLIAITGYVGLVSMLEIEACANQSVVGIIPNEEYPRSFLYPLIKNVIGTISLKQTGSAQQHINKNDINTHKVISPSTSKISSYAEFAESLNNKIAKNLFQNQKLAEIRDTLLPKLMNGEIEVPV